MDGASLPSARPDRPAVSARCLITVDGARLRAALTDIGYGGMGLAAPGAASRLATGDRFTAEVEGLGRVALECRWTRGERVGAQFTHEDAMQPRVAAFLAERGIDAR